MKKLLKTLGKIAVGMLFTVVWLAFCLFMMCVEALFSRPDHGN